MFIAAKGFISCKDFSKFSVYCVSIVVLASMSLVLNYVGPLFF